MKMSNSIRIYGEKDDALSEALAGNPVGSINTLEIEAKK